MLAKLKCKDEYTFIRRGVIGIFYLAEDSVSAECHFTSTDSYLIHNFL